MIADLHTHSTASDGQHSPTALASLAAQKGIQALAVTDHDSISGIAEAQAAAGPLGVTLLPGIELGASEYKNLHILGYCFSPSDPGLTELCAKLRAGREQRKYRILDFLAEKGVRIDLAEVEALAAGGVIARPHFARIMLRHGYVKDIQEAFDRYLDTEEYKRIEREKATAQACIQAIKAAGGRASLAHPYQVGLPDGPLEDLVAQLKSYGLDAIECYYPKHTPEQEAFYLHLAGKYHLHVTGGSDFHGENVKPDIRLANLDLELDWLLQDLL